MLPFLLVSTRHEEDEVASERRAYLNATGLAESDLHVAEFDLVGLPPIDPSDYSAVFVTGSPYRGADGYVSSRGLAAQGELADLLDQLLDAGTPMFVTGESMLVLAERLGLPVDEQKGITGEIVEVELTDAAGDDPVFASMPRIFPAFVSQTRGVGAPDADGVTLARTLGGPVQAMRARENVYATAFNPELDAESIAAKISAFNDAGDMGIGDVEALVTAGRFGGGDHFGARVLASFARHFARGAGF